MQIVTLKSALAQMELENTKLKQSDTIKNKQINNLEIKLQSAMNELKKNRLIPSETTTLQEVTMSHEIENSTLKDIQIY